MLNVGFAALQGGAGRMGAMPVTSDHETCAAVVYLWCRVAPYRKKRRLEPDVAASHEPCLTTAVDGFSAFGGCGATIGVTDNYIYNTCLCFKHTNLCWNSRFAVFLISNTELILMFLRLQT